MAADCALLIENDGRLAARLGADGVHVNGAGAELDGGSQEPETGTDRRRGFLRTRDEAMTAGEMGADYVMFGEPHAGAPTAGLEPLAERVVWWAEISRRRASPMPTRSSGGPLAEAGADFVALGEAVWGSSSPDAAGARLRPGRLLGCEGPMRRFGLAWGWRSARAAQPRPDAGADVHLAVGSPSPSRPNIARAALPPRADGVPADLAFGAYQRGNFLYALLRLNAALTPIPRIPRR